MVNQKMKRNHWVPQSYLRAFAVDPQRRKTIWTLGRSEGEPQLKPIRNVAVRFHLYAPNGPEGRDYSFERKLSSLEQLFGSAAWKTISTDLANLRNPEIRKGIALLAAVMFLRNPLRFEEWKEKHRRTVDHFASLPNLPSKITVKDEEYDLDTSDWELFRRADEEAIKKMWLEQVGSAVWLAELFMQMRWAVTASDAAAFITSDNPVVPLHEDLRFRGFRNAGSSVLFPLSPTRMLTMDWRHEEPDGEYYEAQADSIAAVNYLIWRNGQTMFSSRHPDEVCGEIVAHADSQAVA